MEAARKKAELDVPRKSGEPTLRTALLDRWQALGVRPDDLDEPEIPIVALGVWEAFWEVYGAESLTFAELEAYQRITGRVFENWEARSVILMDRAVRGFLTSRAMEGSDG